MKSKTKKEIKAALFWQCGDYDRKRHKCSMEVKYCPNCGAKIDID